MPIPIRKVAPAEIHQRFNAGRYWIRAQQGEFTEVVLADGHPSPPLAAEPVCTRSQSIVYVDRQGREVAEVHQYVRQGGALGASGRPDPKRLYEHGVLYIARRVRRNQPRHRKRNPRRRRRGR
jgi:hypothetical protein